MIDSPLSLNLLPFNIKCVHLTGFAWRYCSEIHRREAMVLFAGVARGLGWLIRGKVLTGGRVLSRPTLLLFSSLKSRLPERVDVGRDDPIVSGP